MLNKDLVIERLTKAVLGLWLSYGEESGQNPEPLLSPSDKRFDPADLKEANDFLNRVLDDKVKYYEDN